MKAYDITFLGHMCYDEITPFEGPTRVAAGSAVLCGALAATRTGNRVAVVVKMAPRDEAILQPMRDAGIDTYLIPAAETTWSVVIHPVPDVDVRKLILKKSAGFIRLDEIRQSLRILQQAIKQIPEGPINSQKPQYQVRVPAGEAYGRIEAPKGELGYYIVSTGKPNPWRYHVRAPSFINLTAFGPMCIGQKVADAVIILGSIDIILGETDR